jgi:hypothetical protein
VKDPFVEALKDAAFAIYSDAYRRIRTRYDWLDAPITQRRLIFETVPPRHLSGDKYGPYFEDVMTLSREYRKASDIADELGKKRLPKIDYDGDVRELLEYNYQLQLGILQKAT